MIAKVTRGADGTGLVRYLFGQGRANEHADQRVVAVGPGSAAELGVMLDRTSIAELGAYLDGPQLIFGAEVKDGHIWHLSLTNPAADRHLSDAEWSKVVQDTVDRLGFSEGPDRAGCPWVAIGHGLSTAGNEHVHLAVSLVREDGSKASIWQDRVKLSELCSTLERDYGLTVVDGRNRESVPGISRAEDELAVRRGRAEPERDTLARQVRAASVASKDEAEFVRRLRAEQVLVRPRYADGGRECVTGFSAALRPPPGQDPVWFGGGRLAKDLGLPRLRETWDRSPTAQQDAVSEWRSAAKTNLRRDEVGFQAGREERVLAPQGWSMAAERVQEIGRHLEGLSPSDTARWTAAARDLGGVAAQLSVRLEADSPGPLAQAAAVLARSGQAPRGDLHVVRDGPVSDLRDITAIVSQARGTGRDAGRLVTELAGTVDRVAAMHSARGETLQQAKVARSRDDLVSLGARLAVIARALPDDRLMSKMLGLDDPDVGMTEDEERMVRERMASERARGFER